MLEGATPNEIAFVVALLALVLIAPKIPRIGEAIGRWIGGDQPPAGDTPIEDPSARLKRPPRGHPSRPPPDR